MLIEVEHVSPCYAYRDQREGESEEQYAARLADELEQTFQRLGPDSVMAFVAEPVVGATWARSRPCPRISAASAKSATAMACC